MDKLKIRDLDEKNVDDLINLCVPCSAKNDPYFIEGMKMKRLWAREEMQKYGSIAKLAYVKLKPIGMVQYLPHPKEKTIEIICIFVPYRDMLRKGVGTALLNALVEDMKVPKPYFGNDTPNALIVKAFKIPDWYPQNKFFKKRGFRQVEDEDPYTLYYPIKPGYVHSPGEEEFVPQPEDNEKAVIFYDPACPFCIFFSEKTRQAIRKISPKIPIKIVNKSIEAEEVKKRGIVPFCVVNNVPIESSFMEGEKFTSELEHVIGETPTGKERQAKTERKGA